MIANSPLRYPGGKAILSDFLSAVLDKNNLVRPIYVEPFAGGAGAAINLLLSGRVEKIILNDADWNIFAFWKAILDDTDAFIQLVRGTPLTVDEWEIQRFVYNNKSQNLVSKGFAAFFLNRCNRSGILTKGGVIGGRDQSGKWKIDARFNREALIKRIERIAADRDKIEVSNLDAIEFLRRKVLPSPERSQFLLYLDPPYFAKGARLYLNFYKSHDHANLARFLKRIRGVNWIVTYDNISAIRALYKWRTVYQFKLQYSAHNSRKGSEILIANPGLRLPLAELRSLAV